MQAVALGADCALLGGSDGAIRCYSRTQLDTTPAAQQLAAAASSRPLRQLWEVPGAHRQAHACGVTALQLSRRGNFAASAGAGEAGRGAVVTDQ